MPGRAAFAAALALAPGAAGAHFFAQPYTLPVPFSIYAAGAVFALLLSFVLVGAFATLPAARRASEAPAPSAGPRRRASAGVVGGRSISVALLALTIATGLFGRQNAFANFSMTFFWIGFVLAVPYLVALVGDFYAAVNPWKAIVLAIERVAGARFDGRVSYPAWLGDYPALALYMAFVWLELFGQLTPRGLALALVACTAVNVGGAWLVGSDAWFRHGEFFAVFMRLVGRISPYAVPWDPDAPRPPDGARWRLPFVGLLDERIDHPSLALFILFMLSSTAFDGLHATLPWASVFWKGIYPEIAPWFHPAPGQTYALSAQLYYAWQWCSLLLSPFVYLAVFAAFLWTVRRVTATPLTLGELVLRFAPSLVPIAFVYHLTHYYTILVAQAGQLVRLVSDPFGFGWNLFGTAGERIAQVTIDVEAIWHTQVALIVVGHVAGVYLAHLEALRLFASPRRAAVSQVPMLALMMLFTTLGLWILSLPLGPGR